MQSTTLQPITPHDTNKIPLLRKRFQKKFNPYVPALVLDAKGSIRHLTDAAARLLEYDGADSGMDSCFFAHVHGKNLYQVMRDVADMVCYGKGQASWLLRMRTGKGRWRWYKATAVNGLGSSAEEGGAGITVRLRDLQGW